MCPGKKLFSCAASFTCTLCMNFRELSKIHWNNAIGAKDRTLCPNLQIEVEKLCPEDSCAAPFTCTLCMNLRDVFLNHPVESRRCKGSSILSNFANRGRKVLSRGFMRRLPVRSALIPRTHKTPMNFYDRCKGSSILSKFADRGRKCVSRGFMRWTIHPYGLH